MMKPKFEDFMDFVRNGERDPKLGKRLRAHPTADRLLNQARFIWRMVGIHAGVQGEPGYDDLTKSVFGGKGLPPGNRVRFSKRRVPQQDVYESLDATASFGAVDGPEEGDLGTLVGLIRDDRVELAHLPAGAYTDSRSEQAGLFTSRRRPSKGLLIRDEALMITGPGAIDTGADLTLVVQHADSGRSAGDLEILFMPESGPFARFSTDGYGRLEMPLPEQSGVLRLETDEPRFLTLRILNASNF